MYKNGTVQTEQGNTDHYLSQGMFDMLFKTITPLICDIN